ncbi:MAG: UvrD-helicase domain-containing protein, partial [Solirubrobacteraceae bacterium]
YEARKRRLGIMTHDDQLTRLLATLTGPGGAAAAASLRARYRAVLIDEFQDTDPVQWEIVRRAFDDDAISLILIGDPKQAIYAFRGADVYAYLEAAGSARRRATLEVNRRSDRALLDGLDALFGDARLGHPEIVYRHVAAAPGHGGSRLVGTPVSQALRVRVIAAGEPAVARTPTGFANTPSARDFVADDVAGDIVSLLQAPSGIEQRSEDGAVLGVRAVVPGDIAVLVRSHFQAELIQESLQRLGVPAVIGGGGSVFATPAAADWETLLRALERPSHPGRARAAALTAFVGMSAEALALAGEAELETLHRRLYVWARLLRDDGVAALRTRLAGGEQLAARLLEQNGGERYLTDLDHVAELMHGAATAGHLGLTALRSWLRERIAAADREGANDAVTRRLDSDADAVQVLTFHRGKGLEFPFVYCPFLWDVRRPSDRSEPIHFHDPDAGDARAIDVGLTGAEYRRHRHQHELEERGEELRLAYVALTRARHQAVLWWASAWKAKDSALGRLLFAQDAEGNVAPEGRSRLREPEVGARLDQIAALAGHAVAIEQARAHGLAVAWSEGPLATGPLRAAAFQRTLDTRWSRTSYSAITAA